MPSAHEHIDRDGYRKNVGIVVCNDLRQVLWARRIRRDGWQFPQGGVKRDETARQAAFRELEEEVGLTAADVRLLGATENWLRYEVPQRSRRRGFRGQKQRWFLFKLTAPESNVRLDISDSPEFDRWRWIEYWQAAREIVPFKRHVYQQALTELERFLEGDAPPD
ncbi:MAG: RNA pyrophosphohydrolase [Gammaproteobacteria bacterium]